MNNAIGACVCATCPHLHQPNKKKMGVCVAHPPTVKIVGAWPTGPLLGPGAQPQLSPVTQSFYPPVGPDHGCHEHPTWLLRTGQITAAMHDHLVKAVRSELGSENMEVVDADRTD